MQSVSICYDETSDWVEIREDASNKTLVFGITSIGGVIHGGGWIIKFNGDLITIQPTLLANMETQHISLTELKRTKRIQLGKQVKERDYSFSTLFVICVMALAGMYYLSL